MPHVAIEFLINLYSILFSLTHTMDSYYASLRQHKGELGKVSMENSPYSPFLSLMFDRTNTIRCIHLHLNIPRTLSRLSVSTVRPQAR